MGSESPSQRPTPEAAYSYDDGTGKVAQFGESGEVIAEAKTYRYPAEPRASPAGFEHDKQKRLFILKWPDGKTERSATTRRGSSWSTRSPDRCDGPVIKGGEPVYAYLCREEREVT